MNFVYFMYFSMKIIDLQDRFKHYALYERGITAKAVKSVSASLRMLCDHSGTEELRDLDADLIRDFLHYGREVKLWKPKTFHNHWQNFKTFFNWCLKNQLIRKNPVAGIEKPKLEKALPRFISREDAQKVLYYAEWHSWRYSLEKYRNLAIIATFIFTGLRLQELLNLKIENVNLNSRDIIVKMGKGKKDRIVPIHSRLVPILNRYLEEKRKAGKMSMWFFSGIKSDKKLYPKDVQRICRKVSTASGVYFTPHCLRHTFGRLMAEADFGLYKLKEVMGHEQLTTTQRYLSASIPSIKKSFAQVDIL